MAYENIIVEITDHVCLIKLNRPKALNALNSQLVAELSDAVSQAETNDKVRCMIISGCDKAFAAGADISEMSEKTFVDVVTDDLFGTSLLPIQNAKKPIIASVAGYALGGGCELAMMCDFIICADNAKFGQPEINLGVIAGIGGTQRLTRFVGKSKSMDMHLTGRFMDAEEAERSGLVSRVVPLKRLAEVSLSIAIKIAEKSQISVKAAKEAVNRSYETTLSEGLLFERRVFHSMFATEDQKEGMTAFIEKRDPHFRDK
ncbi:MAG: enoyl-CoA hydratase-related protein, partial [Planktomarina sp.]|jgi:enoyl-CoA hydratase|nr:enoyl-CoA hydratase-related protein [Planktomarina sp.]|tara:strand:- start:3901 stop:4677 length:777 start_codon:yes stop_codon:yes gene_type:complete